jgi:hypothetical protein
MPASDANAPARRLRWPVIAFVTLAAVLIGMKCLCPDPAAAFRRQATGSAEVHGTSLRATVAPAPASAPVASAEPTAPASPEPQQAPAAAPVATPPTVAAEAGSAPVAAPKAPEPTKPDPAPAKAAEALHADASAAKAITWDDISKYTYVPPGPDDEGAAATATSAAKTDQIPESIRAMSGNRYKIEGYAVPLDYEKGVVSKLILLPAPLACCFAEAPPMNRWIMVENDAKVEFDYSKYGRLRASGVFEVGEETREGYVVGIYRMKAEKIENVTE